jgi:hypothetical protein
LTRFQLNGNLDASKPHELSFGRNVLKRCDVNEKGRGATDVAGASDLDEVLRVRRAAEVKIFIKLKDVVSIPTI